jgi:hypothetical protein
LANGVQWVSETANSHITITKDIKIADHSNFSADTTVKTASIAPMPGEEYVRVDYETPAPTTREQTSNRSKLVTVSDNQQDCEKLRNEADNLTPPHHEPSQFFPSNKKWIAPKFTPSQGIDTPAPPIIVGPTPTET